MQAMLDHRTRFPLTAKLAYCSTPPFDRSPVTGFERAMPTMAPRRVSAMTLLAISALPAPGTTDTAMPMSALRTTLPDRDVAQIVSPAQHDAGGRGILDHVAGDRAVGLDRYADARAVARVGAGGPTGQQVADDVALHDREPATLVE